MKKNAIKLNESDLNKIVYESVKKILNESGMPDGWSNHNCLASKNSEIMGYDYEGELFGEAYVVKRYEDDKYNVENDDEKLVFPMWFDELESAEDLLKGKDDHYYLKGIINGKVYLLNWQTGGYKKLN